MVYPFDFFTTKAKVRGDPWPAVYRIKRAAERIVEWLLAEDPSFRT
jgi:hypothetical protein